MFHCNCLIVWLFIISKISRMLFVLCISRGFHDLHKTEGRSWPVIVGRDSRDISIINKIMIIDPKNQPSRPPPTCQVRLVEMEDDVELNRKEFSDVSCRNILSIVTDCCEEDPLSEDIDRISTRANIDTDELPLLSRIRIFLQEKRGSIFPFLLIISGTCTSLITVSWYWYKKMVRI